MRRLSFAALALGLLAGCGNGNEPVRDITEITFFGPPVELELGDIVRVEGLVMADGHGSFALFILSGGAGEQANADCVVLRDLSRMQKFLLPSSPPNEPRARSFEATGKVVAGDVIFGRGSFENGGRRHCLIAIDVENLDRLNLSDGLVDQLRMHRLN